MNSVHFLLKANQFLDSRVFEKIILPEESFAKALQSLKTFVFVNNNLCGRLVSSLESHLIYKSHLMKDLNLLQYHFYS